MGEYLFRKHHSGEDNLWLVKPAALTHSKGMTVTDDLNLVLKLGQSVSKMSDRCIVSKYVADCMTFRGFKFDMRWVLVVRSFEPLSVYLYRPFWIRVAKEKFNVGKRR